ncbi:MAG: 6-phosphofructokinase [Bacteroidetes bacterium GWA2_30_7]|nr:MAG: 6-phosphofructokinase [Bacteroidetes bacterium GWA2_30_7]
MKKKKTRVGILTAGGDCPGLNAAIRGVGKTAILHYGMEVVGISSGFLGLINNEVVNLDEQTLSGILSQGGTILGTSREKPFKEDNFSQSINKPKLMKKHYDELGLDCLVCIGGNGTQKTAALLSENGMNIIGIPKTIDNDVWGTDITFGFDSAVNIATDAIDRLYTTANSHKRIMVIEVMGNNAGWLALYSGIAGGGDVILIPEIDYDINVVADYLVKNTYKKKHSSIVVVAEGIKTPEGKKKKNAASYISKKINEITGIETRETILGYIQRGGSPSPMDRVLATQYGAFAAQLIDEKKFGVMVAMKKGKIESVPLIEVGGKTRIIDINHSLIKKARYMETSFGN